MEGKRSMLVSGGNLPRKASGRRALTLAKGKFWLVNSAMRMTVAKL